jgi:hypothetical protein
MPSDYGKGPVARYHGLKNIKAILGGFPEERHTQSHEAKSKSSLPSKEGPIAGKVGNLLRVWWSKSPWDDYTQVAYLHSAQQARLVYHNASYFDLAVMREQPSSPNDLASFETLSHIHHANIAKTYDVFLDKGMTFVITEHLDLSILQIDFEKHQLEEWEIATIIVQVESHLYIGAAFVNKYRSLKELDISCQWDYLAGVYLLEISTYLSRET